MIIWDIAGPDYSQLTVLSGCHADWITCCDWSDANDFLVCVFPILMRLQAAVACI